MTNETTATAGTPNSDTTAQSTAATEAATAAAAAATTQQKPASETVVKPAEVTASTTVKDETKPAEKPAGDTKPEAKTEETPEAKAAREAADAAKAADTAKAPEKYEAFTLPDGVKVPPENEAKVIAAAKELNLPQEGAQKLMDAAVDMQKTFAANMDAKITAVRAEWESNSRADKEFGGDNFDVNLAIAKTAVNAFGSPAFKALLKDSGVGSHPEFLRTFINIGKSISQDTTVTGGDGTPSAEATGFTAAASKLYGKK